VIKLKDKQEIILEYIRNGKSQRQISRETGISRETIRKYINEYEKKLVELGSIKEGDELIKVDLIDEIVKTPKYNAGKREKKY
jgi:transposase-like protein